MAGSAMYLRCLAFLSLFAVSWAQNIDCGDRAGPSCGNSWVHVACGKGESCCFDEFNSGWCCPSGYKCNGYFFPPFDLSHCMTPGKTSQSCVCDEQADYEIIAMDPVGEVEVDDAWSSNLTACCEYPASCGWSTTITRTDSQKVSWSDTTEVGSHMTWNVEAGPAIKLGEIGFEVKNSFQSGESTSTSTSQSYAGTCFCDGEFCPGPFTSLDYKMRVVRSTQAVQIKARKCDVTKTFAGTVSTLQWKGGAQCVIQNRLWSCPSDSRRLLSSGTAPTLVV